MTAPFWSAAAASLRVAMRAGLGGARWSRPALDAFRDRQLRRLVAHAYAQVPFHRRRMRERGVAASDVRGVGDLWRLPITTKREMQSCGDADLLSATADPTRLIERRTTGSTGQPLRIRRTWLEERTLGALRWRALHSMGARRADRYVEIEERPPRDPNDREWLHDLLQRSGLYRQLRIDALQPAEAILAAIAAFGPDVISGYGGVVARAARIAAQSESAPRPRLVVSHSDTLTPQLRSAIGTGFGAPVLEIYDCNECNVVAWECRASGALHTCDDSTIVEVVDEAGRPVGPGEPGEIVITALHSFSMPFIRYRLGDLVVRGPDRCSCGSAFGTIRAVRGRMFDYFPLADGRTLHPYELIDVLWERAPWIAEFRLLQERRDLVVLLFACGEAPTGEQLRSLGEGLRARLGPRVELRVERRAGFDEGPTAKLRVCRSRVASEYEGV